jgi:hypothetical protein
VTPAADQADPLDHLPPLDLPGEVTRSATTPPPPPAAAREEGPTDRPGRPEAGRGAGGQVSPTVSAATDTKPESTSATPAGPGMVRFTPVDLKLAGGSLPSPAGLNWLAEKGYRTLLDLRDSAAVSPAFIAEATQRGLRYIALPINGQPIDRQLVARFHYEISAAEARPLYFFDADGSRAGALWYLRRVSVDRVDHALARREAEDLGLVARADWEVATAASARLNAPSATSEPSGSTPSPAPADPSPPAPSAEKPSARASEPVPSSSASTSTSATPPTSTSQSPPTAALIQRTSSDHPAPPDAMAWRPFAALVLTGLSLPVAYWTRTVLPAALERARASLPAPEPRPRPSSLESDG